MLCRYENLLLRQIGQNVELGQRSNLNFGLFSKPHGKFKLAIIKLPAFVVRPAMKSHLAHGHNNVAIKLESVN